MGQWWCRAAPELSVKIPYSNNRYQDDPLSKHDRRETVPLLHFFSLVPFQSWMSTKGNFRTIWSGWRCGNSWPTRTWCSAAGTCRATSPWSRRAGTTVSSACSCRCSASRASTWPGAGAATPPLPRSPSAWSRGWRSTSPSGPGRLSWCSPAPSRATSSPTKSRRSSGKGRRSRNWTYFACTQLIRDKTPFDTIFRFISNVKLKLKNFKIFKSRKLAI